MGGRHRSCVRRGRRTARRCAPPSPPSSTAHRWRALSVGGRSAAPPPPRPSQESRMAVIGRSSDRRRGSLFFTPQLTPQLAAAAGRTTPAGPNTRRPARNQARRPPAAASGPPKPAVLATSRCHPPKRANCAIACNRVAHLDPTMAVILKLSLPHAGHGSALPTQKHALRGWRAIQPPRRGAKNVTVGIFEAPRGGQSVGWD